MTPSLEALTFFRVREDTAYKTYQDYINCLAANPVDIASWHTARELRHAWELALADWKRAISANYFGPCRHQLHERAHEAQRCEYCHMMSMYSRLSSCEVDDD